MSNIIVLSDIVIGEDMIETLIKNAEAQLTKAFKTADEIS